MAEYQYRRRRKKRRSYIDLIVIAMLLMLLILLVALAFLRPKLGGSVKSEVRILGTESEQGVVLLRPTELVKNGDRVF